jgi:hypothetical protein
MPGEMYCVVERHRATGMIDGLVMNRNVALVIVRPVW